MEKIIGFLFPIDEELKQNQNKLLTIDKGRVNVTNSVFNNDYLSNKILEKYLFDARVREEELNKLDNEPENIFSFKQNPVLTKQKFNHKFK